MKASTAAGKRTGKKYRYILLNIAGLCIIEYFHSLQLSEGKQTRQNRMKKSYKECKYRKVPWYYRHSKKPEKKTALM